MTATQATLRKLTDKHGQALVALARRTLMEHFNQRMPEPQATELERVIQDPALRQCCGTFVTIKKNGQLRGCIGSLTGREPLAEGVRHNALNAALQDSRFAALDSDELDMISIEVSVLTEPQELAYRDSDDLIAKLRPRVDGVTLRMGYCGATFLPQVWDQLPEAVDFLTHLCLKAGLPANAWQNGQLTVETYQVQYFEESD